MARPIMAEDNVLEDGDFWPIVKRLLGCFEVELEDSGIQISCFVGVVAGAGVESALSETECGAMGFIHLLNAYPSSSFPAADEAAACAAPLAATFEIGLWRKTPAPERNKIAPSKAQWFEATRLSFVDMAACRRAVMCCVQSYEAETGEDLDLVMGTWEPIGPEEGVVGGSWSFTLGALR